VLYTKRGKINIANAAFREDPAPIEADCPCYTCQNFSRAYLRHLLLADELLAYTLNSIHNQHLIVNLVAQMRSAIAAARVHELRRDWLGPYLAGQAFGPSPTDASD
jgi:queuine tRNA-ribosyltransferase